MTRSASPPAAGIGLRAPHLAEVRHVEEPHCLAHGGVLLQHAAVGVLDGHLPPAEVGELGPQGHMPVVQW